MKPFLDINSVFLFVVFVFDSREFMTNQVSLCTQQRYIVRPARRFKNPNIGVLSDAIEVRPLKLCMMINNLLYRCHTMLCTLREKCDFVVHRVACVIAHRSFRACSISAGGKQGFSLTNQSRGEEVECKNSRWRTYRFDFSLKPHLRESVVSSRLLSPRYPRSHTPLSLLSTHKWSKSR